MHSHRGGPYRSRRPRPKPDPNQLSRPAPYISGPIGPVVPPPVVPKVGVVAESPLIDTGEPATACGLLDGGGGWE